MSTNTRRRKIFPSLVFALVLISGMFTTGVFLRLVLVLISMSQVDVNQAYARKVLPVCVFGKTSPMTKSNTSELAE